MEWLDYLLEVHTIVLGLLLILIYLFSTRNHGYWKKRGIPYVTPYPFFGSHVEILRKNLEDVELARYKKYGRIYGHFEANKPCISISDPNLLKYIFAKDFHNFTTRRIFESGDPIADKMLTVIHGDDWKRIRTIVSPTFTTGKIRRVMSIFRDCSATLIENFKEASDQGESVDVSKIFGAFTMDVIASSAFSTKLDSHKDPENEFVKKAKAAFQLKVNYKLFLLILAPKLLPKLKISFFDRENTEFFKNLTLEIMEKRKRNGETRNDFLQLLMDSAEEVSAEEKYDESSDDIVKNYGDDSSNHSMYKDVGRKHLSMDELVAQCVIFFLAGYHTTATTLTMTAYQLALNPDIEEELFQEIKKSLEETNGELTYDSVQRMKYLDNVISETLRMYTPLVRLDRTAEADYNLGETGIVIPKGMVIGVPIFAMHKDPEFFPEPEKYNPDRFSPEEREKQIPYTYLPFGAGPRNCVGMRFALVELKVCLVYVLSHFKIMKSSDTKIPIEFGKGTGLLQPKSVMLRIEPRSDCPLKF